VGKPQESTWVGSLRLPPHLQQTDRQVTKCGPMAKKKVHRKLDEAHIVQYTHQASRAKL